MSEPTRDPYQVSCAGKGLKQLKALLQRAITLGRRTEFLTALKDINEKLTSDPLAWGDPQFHMRQLGLLGCHAIHNFLHLFYAVDEQRRLVYVKEFLPLPHSWIVDGE